MRLIRAYNTAGKSRFLCRRKCNISPIEYLEDGYVWATDWDLELYLPHLPQDIAAVVIPMNAFRPGSGKNGHRCRVEEVIENRFSYTVILSPVLSGDDVSLKWTIPKKEWQRICSDVISVNIPAHGIFSLKHK